MAKMQIELPQEVDDVITTRVHLNRLFKKGAASKAELVQEIVSSWASENEYETNATAEGIGGK